MEVSNLKEIVDQLSAREKKLLYILVCFLIVMIGWFLVITPQLDKKTSLNQQYESVLMENSSKETELARYLAAPDELKIKQESLKEIIEKYNPIMSNEKIDKLLTSAFLTNGLKPISLSISDVKAATTTDTTNAEDAADKIKESSYVQQATVSVSVSGSLEQITSTVNSLHKMKGVEISSFSYTEAIATTASTTATLTIVVYMAQQ